ncbi:MAG: hypothetical protein HQL55_18435 [Magnetococcales bacterium]|nr:hypothetical protein [Magnetococcales bacterium]
MSKFSPCHVLVVIGNPETMKVEKYARFQNGKMEGWVHGTLEDLKELIRSWVQFASSEPFPLHRPPG